MINDIYTELPVSSLPCLNDARWTWDKEEKDFRDNLTESITKVGIKDPIHVWYENDLSPKHTKFMVRTGASRLRVAVKLGIKNVKAIVTQFKSEKSPLTGCTLHTDKVIKQLFAFPDKVRIKRNKEGWIESISTGGSKKFIERYKNHEIY
tara:strand:+ start:327 stop:776 length:450 start_codon:yes stop_codon:yes gene_type:complete